MPEQRSRIQVLRDPPRRNRGTLTRGLVVADPGDTVIRDGGDYGSGLIRGVSICTRGEAISHGTWLDSEFIASIARMGGEAPNGIKARFTHPSLSGDGLGTFLGRVKNTRVVGDRAVGDLHFSRAAHHAPDGDLAEYIMDLAESDPAAFGMSIVFERDFEAEDEFGSANKSLVEYDDRRQMEFVSPDPDNTDNLPHARLARLWAADAVDDPAANPTGLFQREQDIAREADLVLAYSLGLSNAAPTCHAFDVNPDRAKGFVSRFMESRGLRLTNIKETPMSVEEAKEVKAEAATQPQDSGEGQAETVATQEAEQQPQASGSQDDEAKPETPSKDAADGAQAPAEQPASETPSHAENDSQSAMASGRAECHRFIAAFGSQGGTWFADGLTFEQAQAKFADGLKTENEALRKRLAAAGEDAGEATPLAFQPTNDNDARTRKFAGALGDSLGRVAANIKIRRANETK